MRFYAVIPDPDPYIIAELASYPSEGVVPPLPIEVEWVGARYLAAPELEQLPEGPAMLATWRAGDDSRWETSCRERDAIAEADWIVDRAAFEQLGRAAFE